MAIDEEILSILDGCSDTFTPYFELNEKCDTLSIYFEPDADYSVRLSDHVTLYKSLETDELVGCRIKGISGIIEDLPNYIHAEHGQVSLSVIFLLFRGESPSEDVRQTINRLASAVKERNMQFNPAVV